MEKSNDKKHKAQPKKIDSNVPAQKVMPDPWT
jgi:hypothetical protein